MPVISNTDVMAPLEGPLRPRTVRFGRDLQGTSSRMWGPKDQDQDDGGHCLRRGHSVDRYRPLTPPSLQRTPPPPGPRHRPAPPPSGGPSGPQHSADEPVVDPPDGLHQGIRDSSAALPSPA